MDEEGAGGEETLAGQLNCCGPGGSQSESLKLSRTINEVHFIVQCTKTQQAILVIVQKLEIMCYLLDPY